MKIINPSKKISILFLIITFLFLETNEVCSSNKFRVKILSSKFIYENAPFPECHASTIVETDDGFLAAWFGGTHEKHPDVCIYISKEKRGKWSTPLLVADGIVNDTLRYPCWNPVLFKKDNGDIVLYYKVGPDPRGWWGVYKISKDEGKSWSNEVPIPNRLLGPIKNKPERLKNGTILYPTSYEKSRQEWEIYIETSDQDLKHWGKTAINNNGFTVG